MTAVLAGLLVTACVFAGAMAGMLASQILPKQHLSRETQDVVRLGTGMLSLLSSILLGLLIANAKTASDTTDHELRAFAADLIALDRTLAGFGASAAPARALLVRSTTRTLADLWPAQPGAFAGLDETSAIRLLEQARQAIGGLTPADPFQVWLRDHALGTASGLLHQRWLMVAQAGSTIRPVVVGLLVCWVVAIFGCFGLNAPRNAVVVAAFLVCSAAIGSAVFLLMEIDTPFAGLLRISPEPMQRALAEMTVR